MQEILSQLENLALGSVPTILLFIVLVLAYRFLVQGPLTAVLKDRYNRTEGARENAKKAIAVADAKTSEYADRLRQARAEAYKAREARAKQLTAERDAALEAARKAASDKVAQARTEIDGEAETARKSIQSTVGELASQVVRAVLPAAAGGTR